MLNTNQFIIKLSKSIPVIKKLFDPKKIKIERGIADIITIIKESIKEGFSKLSFKVLVGFKKMFIAMLNITPFLY